MDFRQIGSNIEIYSLKNFDLSQTFDCGQCFRFDNFDGKYRGVAFGKTLIACQKRSSVVLENVSLDDFKCVWNNYFDFDIDYGKIAESLSGISLVMDAAIEECSGVRILRQGPWETLCSFIISQNNNIPRIKKIINSLCTFFGDDIGGGAYSFPNSQLLASLSEEDLAPIRAGFRAKYIIDAARKVSLGIVDFENLKKASDEDAKNILMQINGVGPKVADCVLLYGMHRLSAFPMDVWMKRVMDKFFPDKKPEIFGEYAGIAQQYLYHYSRNHPEIFEH